MHRVDPSRYRLRSIVDLIDDVHACDQGGIDDPSAGQSWECPGCRKDYDPGEYATALRRFLLVGGPDQDGWTHVAMAAEAMTMMAGVSFGPARIRRWMDRGQIASMCRWKPGTVTGLRFVLWTDVRDRAERRSAGSRSSSWSVAGRRCRRTDSAPQSARVRTSTPRVRVWRFTLLGWRSSSRSGPLRPVTRRGIRACGTPTE